MAWFRFSLVFLALVLIGCGSREKKEVQVGSDSYGHSEMSDDLSGLPEAFRYPDAELVGANEDSTPRYVSRNFVLRTQDSFPQVFRFYKKGFDGLLNGFEVGCSYSDDEVTFTADDGEGNESLMCVLVREKEGTLIVIVHRQERHRGISI
ncbi:MAG: hypothetical protein ABIK23_01580 [candidate division WOR-3 bacterium]